MARPAVVLVFAFEAARSLFVVVPFGEILLLSVFILERLFVVLGGSLVVVLLPGAPPFQFGLDFGLALLDLTQIPFHSLKGHPGLGDLFRVFVHDPFQTPLVDPPLMLDTAEIGFKLSMFR